MTKNAKMGKLFPLFAALSAVVIIAGIVLFALMGFNTSADRVKYKTVEVRYDVQVDINELTEGLETSCEEAFDANGLTFEKKTVPEVDGTYLGETTDMLLSYTFSASASDEAIEAARAAIAAEIAANYSAYNVHVAAHTVTNVPLEGAAWRAAVAVAVGVVVVLIYAGVRFGVAAGLTGLAVCVHDVLFTLAFFAVTRIPVFSTGAILFGAVSAVVSLVLWLIRCMRMREDFKDEEFKKLSAEEAVQRSAANSFKLVLGTAIAFAAVFIIVGAVAASGVRLMVLPMVVCAAVSAYSTLLLAPAVYAKLKKPFDKLKANHKPRYVGKKKGDKANNEA